MGCKKIKFTVKKSSSEIGAEDDCKIPVLGGSRMGWSNP